MNIRVYLPDGSTRFYENIDYGIWKDSGCLSISRHGKRIIMYSAIGWTQLEPDAELREPSVVTL